MKMMVDGDYCIFYWRSRNKIIINLPPTLDTIQDSRTMPVDRRVDISDSELMTLLQMVKIICQKEPDDVPQL